MTEEQISNVSPVGKVFLAGGASIALVLGWINQLCAAAIASAGLSGSPLSTYYEPSYYLTIGGVGLFLLGLFISIGGMSKENKNAAVKAILSSILFLVGMCIMFINIEAGEEVEEAAKSAYLIIAIRAGLIFIGLFFFFKAISKAEIKGRKVWKMIPKIAVLLLMLTSLLMFIPVVGDIIFSIVYLFIGIILIVCLYPILLNN